MKKVKRRLTLESVQLIKWANAPVDRIGAKIHLRHLRYDDASGVLREKEIEADLSYNDLLTLAAMIKTRLVDCEKRISGIRKAWDTGDRWGRGEDV